MLKEDSLQLVTNQTLLLDDIKNRGMKQTVLNQLGQLKLIYTYIGTSSPWGDIWSDSNFDKSASILNSKVSLDEKITKLNELLAGLSAVSSFTPYNKLKDDSSKSRSLKLYEYSHNRMKENCADLLGSIVNSHLSDFLSVEYNMPFYIIPTEWPPSFSLRPKECYIWLAPAHKLIDQEYHSTLLNTFNSLIHSPSKMLLVVLPKSFLTDIKIKKLRSTILQHASKAIIMKYNTFFSGLLLVINKKKHVASHEKLALPCFFFSSNDMQGNADYHSYFKKLAGFIRSTPHTDWHLVNNKGKAQCQFSSTSTITLGSIADVIPFSKAKSKEIDSSILKTHAVNEQGVQLINDYESFLVKNADLLQGKGVKSTPVLLTLKDILVIRGQTFKVVNIKQYTGHTLLLQSNYFLIRLKEEADSKKIEDAINCFFKNNISALNAIKALNQELIKLIPIDN